MNSINIPILSFLRGGYIKIVESFVNTIYHYSKWKFFMDFASNGRRPRLIPILSIRWKFLNPVFRFVMKLRADRYCPSRASIVYMYSTRGTVWKEGQKHVDVNDGDKVTHAIHTYHR